MKKEKIETRSEEETVALGAEFALTLNPGDTVAFYGDLGSGKTEFIKGVCERFNVDEIVNSPTFTFINKYGGEIDDEEISIYHIDLYRVEKTEDLEEIGFAECVHSNDSIKLIEWAERAATEIPSKRINIYIQFEEEEELRQITIEDLRE